MGPRCFAAAACVFSLLGGCASLPPGFHFPKTESSALQYPSDTRLGRSVEAGSRRHQGKSGFRLLSAGVDGILTRVQMAEAAERTLDIQYYIYREDDTSRLLTDAIVRAADRGVRVRVLLDDHGAAHRKLTAALDGHPRIDVRLFNPFSYRGDSRLMRWIELAFHAPRLKYRMHNKLIVADNAVALIGGRNVGDEYFQAKPDFEFGDYDLFAAGPIVRDMSASFDDYWRSALAIPGEALHGAGVDLQHFRDSLRAHRERMEGDDNLRRLSTSEPLAAMMAGTPPLIWAHAEVVVDPPNKASPEDRDASNWLEHDVLARAAAQTRSEFILVSPYLVPGDEGLRFLMELRRRGVRIRVLTNSLEATDVAASHAGYARYRPTFLDAGVELHEARPRLEKPDRRGASIAAPQSGRFSLHAKVLVFDREKVFIGSMNFDRRSIVMNTELGVMIHSPELARQVVRQFESMTDPANSYQVIRADNDSFEGPRLLWRTRKNGEVVELDAEPVRSIWQRLTVDLLLLLPLDALLGETDLQQSVPAATPAGGPGP